MRIYQRKSNRGNWDPECMENAIEAVYSGSMGYLKASRSFGVPQTTLERKVKEKRTTNDQTKFQVVKSLGPRTTTFTEDEEKQLVSYLKKMEERLFGLTVMDFRKLAYQWATKLGKQHRFSKEKEMAGRDWVHLFLKRHSSLSIRRPENTSAARAMGFNRVAVNQFFDLLVDVIDKYKLTAEQIWNCDETGVSIVPKTRSKIIAQKGRKQVGALTSAERGATVTVEICFNGVGRYLPPMFIFPRVRLNPELMNDCPPGAWAECHPSGWIQTDIFFNWFKKFAELSGASKESPVLLLLDGHHSHTKNIELIAFARDQGIILLCFPPHCTHRLQPLDVCFMKPLSTYYEAEVNTWLRSNPGRVVTQFQIAKLFGNAFIKSANMLTAMNGFKKTGIWPCDRNVFTDVDFAPAETTNRPPPEEADEEPITNNANIDPECLPADNETITNKKTSDPRNLPGCSKWINRERPRSPVVSPQRDEEHISPEATPKSYPEHSTPEKIFSPEDIMPIPVELSKKERPNRKRGKSVILTSTPYKDELQADIDKKLEQEKRKSLKTDKKGKKSTQTKEKKQKQKTVKRQVFAPTQQKRLRKESSPSSSSEEDEEDDAACLYCNYLYSESSEGWVQCWQCKKWAHCSCAGEDDEDDEVVHLCTLCQ